MAAGLKPKARLAMARRFVSFCQTSQQNKLRLLLSVVRNQVGFAQCVFHRCLGVRCSFQHTRLLRGQSSDCPDSVWTIATPEKIQTASGKSPSPQSILSTPSIELAGRKGQTSYDQLAVARSARSAFQLFTPAPVAR